MLSGLSADAKSQPGEVAGRTPPARRGSREHTWINEVVQKREGNLGLSSQESGLGLVARKDSPEEVTSVRRKLPCRLARSSDSSTSSKHGQRDPLPWMMALGKNRRLRSSVVHRRAQPVQVIACARIGQLRRQGGLG
ncbi:hypothetical protein KIL84_000468 [Mauremys mutica]|uniref:Uncharacterized protein n=1 Tax=Mauremys mutica TaxID=74926 RepID=A0A9D4ASR3_9SAUR|nr:hypothetical protein KIL84_000468 [Mauremys mutica]